jgi:cysteine-rich repeat protein
MGRAQWAANALTLAIGLASPLGLQAQAPAELWSEGSAAGELSVGCGDGAITGGEECNDANLASGDCCSANCQFEPDSAACFAGAAAVHSGFFAGPFQDLTAGWEFSVRSDLTVTALGVYDCGDNGLAENHQVGIWDKAAGPLLIETATIPSGNGADLVSHFRHVPIPALQLLAGRTYVIGALYPKSGVDCVVDSGTFTFDPRITFVTGREIFSPSGFSYPSSPDTYRFGPTFLFDSLRGNGVVDAGEQCDDNDVASGDGCSSNGAIESGYACTGVPSVCATVCGDGTIAGAETCDDGDALPGDGCSAACAIETDYTCRGTPSVCTNTCGNGVVDGGEFCDDGNRVDDDGCSSLCAVEASYTCLGSPSVCTTKCGDGAIGPLEQCDDGNVRQGDCCSKNCQFVPTNAACRKSMPVPSGGGGSGGAGVVEGWEFTVSSSVTVAALGVFDEPSSAGLAEPHAMAIWNGSQQVLATATVPAGTSATLVNGFRYVPIAALILTPGQNYTIGAYFPPPRDDAVIGAHSLPLDSRLSLVRGRRLPFVGNLVFPTTVGSDPQVGAGFLLEFTGCGNAALDAGEQCDDGNVSDGDCCSSTCQITAGPACTRGDACLGDCDHDGLAGGDDLAKIRDIIIRCGSCPGGAGGVAAGCVAIPGADKQCAAADFDGDGCLSAAELTRVIADIVEDPSTGCPPAPE